MTFTREAGSALPDLLTRGPLDHYIGGRRHQAAAGQQLATRNPATGEVVTHLARGDSRDVDAAVASARAAFEGEWSRITPHQRNELLRQVHDVVDKNYEELALLESLDMGVPLQRARQSRTGLLKFISYFATQAFNTAGDVLPHSLGGHVMAMTLQAPVGVVGGIIAWNGPLTSQWWVLGGALATGCTVVLKPAEDASLTTLRTAELLTEAGVPDGVVNVVTGLGSEAGAALAEHTDVDRVAFTGSTETGRSIIRASATNMKRLQLELGGKSPDIIFADADLDRAVPGAAMGVFANTGQVCLAGTRVLVERSVQTEVVERMAEFAASLKVGDPLNPDTDLGPIVSQVQLDRVMGYVASGRDEGADLVIGGERLGGDLAEGYYIGPTIFNNVSNDMAIAREEIFGPVMSVIPFDTPEEALALANDTNFGLGGAVWSRDVGQIMRMVHGIRTGTVWVNCYGVVDPAVGFGGFKESGYGQKGGPRHVDGFLYTKTVYLNAD